MASHYDTNYPLRDTSFVGANDGGSSSALLLEIANQLRGKPRDGYSIWLVWDDAEEAIKPDTEMPFEKDSLYGISHLADKWKADGTSKKIKAFLLADMIGDADLNVDRDTNSTPWLQSVVLKRPRGWDINPTSLRARFPWRTIICPSCTWACPRST